MINYINIVKLVDRFIGPFLLIIIVPLKKFKIKSIPRKVLVVRPGGLGDAALLAPVLHMVKKKYPFVQLDILCERRNAGIFQALSFIDALYLYQKPGHLISLYRTNYDMIIDTEQSHILSAVLCRFFKATYKIGFEAYGRGKLFHYAQDYSHDVYESTMFLTLIRAVFDLDTTLELETSLFKKPDEGWSEKVDHITSTGKDVICLFPGASIDERLWPDDRWASVADFLHDNGFQPVLIGGKLEKDQCGNIQKLCHSDGAVNMCGKLSLLETAWLFKYSKLLISTDSGILHLGVICKLPTVSLFGAGIQNKWAPRGDEHKVISLGLPCSPCTVYGNTPSCPNGNECMKGIGTTQVIDGIIRNLDKLIN